MRWRSRRHRDDSRERPRRPPPPDSAAAEPPRPPVEDTHRRDAAGDDEEPGERPAAPPPSADEELFGNGGDASADRNPDTAPDHDPDTDPAPGPAPEPRVARVEEHEDDWSAAAAQALAEHLHPPAEDESATGDHGHAASAADEAATGDDAPPASGPTAHAQATGEDVPGASAPQSAPRPTPPGAVPAAPPARPTATAGAHEAAGAPTVSRQQLAVAIRAVVRRALDEDLDVAGDVTSEATVPPDARGRARLVARADGVVSGLDVVAVVYDHLDPRVEVRAVAGDGDRVRTGDVVAEVTGPLRSVLAGERTALNLVTHLSGVATTTARWVEAVAGTGCAIRDTRKTTPGLRLLEKAAVRAGGGTSHRTGLSDALLVKDNHAAAAGGVAAATRGALGGARGRHVQVEVDSMRELEDAVEAGARDLLLDNFDLDATSRAVSRIRELEATHGRILIESSGGLDLGVARAYAQAGVDRLAVGALTHSAPQLDLALDLDPAPVAPATRYAAAPAPPTPGPSTPGPSAPGPSAPPTSAPGTRER